MGREGNEMRKGQEGEGRGCGQDRTLELQVHGVLHISVKKPLMAATMVDGEFPWRAPSASAAEDMKRM